MAISYPLALPTSIGLASISFRTVNAVALSQSPFTYKQQVVAHAGERWEADCSIPPLRKDVAEDWAGWLTALRGQYGTFLLNDPNNTSPRGTEQTSASITGSAGDRSVSVTMTGSLLRGDYFQLGSGANSRLYKVLEDQSGSGTLEIWPALRAAASSASADLTSPAGVFRLNSNSNGWDINSISQYGLSFSAIEVIT